VGQLVEAGIDDVKSEIDDSSMIDDCRLLIGQLKAFDHQFPIINRATSNGSSISNFKSSMLAVS
jgi:hypothetical protein